MDTYPLPNELKTEFVTYLSPPIMVAFLGGARQLRAVDHGVCMAHSIINGKCKAFNVEIRLEKWAFSPPRPSIAQKKSWLSVLLTMANGQWSSSCFCAVSSTLVEDDTVTDVMIIILVAMHSGDRCCPLCSRVQVIRKEYWMEDWKKRSG
ncbi:hypothetical protein NC651_025042 [Populus alba x Populus x berolinensis]|nr:hypothetical protein NC651_025042 [Populus alba x Populus x berolinensis]